MQAVEALDKAQKQIEKLTKADKIAKPPKPPKLHKLKQRPAYDAKLAKTLALQVKAKPAPKGTTPHKIAAASRDLSRYARAKLPQAKLAQAKTPPRAKAVLAKPAKTVKKASPKASAKRLDKAKRVIGSLAPEEQLPAKLAVRFGKKYGVAPSVLMAQMRQESGFDPGAVSSMGAQGLSQFIPSTAQAYKVKYGTSRKAQKTQVRGQAHYLSDLGFQRDPQGALSSYSGGYAASAYNNPVLEGAQDYKKLDKVASVKGVGTKAAKQLPGPWAGSRKAVAIGTRGIAKARGGKRTPEENAAVGGSTTSDHLTTNKSTYAQDISASGAEGTKVFKQVAKNLGIKNAQPGTYNWYTSPKAPGYRFQILWEVEGHFDHVHVGAEWQGSSAAATSTATTSTGGYTTSGGTTTPVSGATSASGTTSPASTSESNKAALLREINQGRKRAAKKIGSYREGLKPPSSTSSGTRTSSSSSSSSRKISLGL
jgi:soluble lytic murein transglycosylase-like protein